MNPYQTRSTEGLSGVELTIALYDGIMRFLYRAIEAVERGDAGERRAAVKRALDILMYLQATLRTDIGGKPAEALGEFYVAMFALILQGSQRASNEKFLKAIQFVKNVRDAWREVVNDPAANGPINLAANSANLRSSPAPAYAPASDGRESANWLA
jgi:flagellar secretion chaperone FliS